MTTVVNYEMAKSWVNSSIEERGEEFVYVSSDPDGECLYVHVDEQGDKKVAGCILGHMLVAQGVLTIGQMHQIQVDTGSNNIRAIKNLVEDASDFTFTTKAIDFLRLVQAHQDDKASWGDARDMAQYAMGINHEGYDSAEGIAVGRGI